MVKTLLIVLGTMTLAIVLVVAGFTVGASWRQSRESYGVAGDGTQVAEPGQAMGPGMMGYGWGDVPSGPAQDVPCAGICTAPGEGDSASLDGVDAAVHDYVARLGYTGLEVAEVMEFERNYYAIVAEEDTGIGAMELLVDKERGAVGPEPGPNMMWNAKYGMMGRGGMMGGYAAYEMTLSPEEARDVAQRWLDANLPGRSAGEADAFYGYYTLHFLHDGEIEGMLSVHGRTGDVWYHSWHGGFVTMIEGHG
jgi:hypothetical protein